MDISDGLSSELLHICRASHTGCRVYEDRIPIDYQTAVMAEELGMNLVTAALNGGEDYELLFTVPLSDHEKIKNLPGIKVIGHITKRESGCALVTRDGNEMQLRAQGFNHMAPSSTDAHIRLPQKVRKPPDKHTSTALASYTKSIIFEESFFTNAQHTTPSSGD